MTGVDVFYGLVGLGCLALLVSAALAIPQAIRAAERIATAARPQPPPPAREGDPWGPRP